MTDPTKISPTATDALEKDFEDSIAERYNRDYHKSPIMRYFDSQFVDYVCEHYHSQDRVLDLACGPASLWGIFATKLGGTDNIVGVDLSPKMIEQAQSLYPDGKFEVGSFFDLPFDSGSFDIVIVSSAFHHVHDDLLIKALEEINRVLDEHGVLIGREPLQSKRLSDTDGWLSGALMHFRHMVYRLNHTREYPEPDPGPNHHAYDPEEFLQFISTTFAIKGVSFHNPVSPFIARCKDALVAHIAAFLDLSVAHRGGHELFYTATKNYSESADVSQCIQNFIAQNAITDNDKLNFAASLEVASRHLEDYLTANAPKSDTTESKR
ncbi:MAG: class I SAM-dependent methyltransferase [Proteobacteria bacterium]|nr:class I SAM-dependent methyltransferase [Pseudomonadota bacterium]MBU4276295.1 class I SAM-dependent methyltransferase [Pseudomonadota bacterium]MBU4383634.1 class I SAM-dependent methyltransferase [Pseudomonadota bacterium]MCG2763860.1 class I SAM-dependent methyltransferase [Desulfarculaceae bacterium]